jgi:pimeloyl-ACP methyl ester carboxylesterase
VLIVDRDDRAADTFLGKRLEGLGANVTRIRPAGTAEMLAHGTAFRMPGAALEAITSWFHNWQPAMNVAGPRAGSTLDASESMNGPGYEERAVRFGAGARLFGILSRPTAAGGSTPAIILLNTGYEYRVGPHRIYVPLAREWAARGHAVLRYDLGGVGDSEPPPGAPENDPYPAHALDDLREAVDFIRKQAPGRRVIVAGLCSGGWHAFCAARDGLAVDAIVSINPPLYLRGGMATIQGRKRYEEIGAFRSALVDSALLAEMLRGRSSSTTLMRSAAFYLRWKASRYIDTLSGGRLMEGLARDLNGIRTRGIASLFVFSQGDEGLGYFESCASPALRARQSRKTVGHVVVDGAGHTFSQPEAQRAMREFLIEFVARQSELPKQPTRAARPFRGLLRSARIPISWRRLHRSRQAT